MADVEEVAGIGCGLLVMGTMGLLFLTLLMVRAALWAWGIY